MYCKKDAAAKPNAKNRGPGSILPQLTITLVFAVLAALRVADTYSPKRGPRTPMEPFGPPGDNSNGTASEIEVAGGSDPGEGNFRDGTENRRGDLPEVVGP